VHHSPSCRPGSQWEMDEIIRNKYLTKTVFLMPPDPSFRRWKELREDWDLVEKRMAANNITIPQCGRDGLLFAVDATGQCATEKLQLESPKHLLKAITRLSSPVVSSKRATLLARIFSSQKIQYDDLHATPIH
jgi:hypothetical protein